MAESGYSLTARTIAGTAVPVARYPSVRPDGFYAAWAKRFLDLVIALMVLPICAPLVAIFWLAARLDGGPGFFRQQRVGRNGDIFICWKLRTMVLDADRILEDLCAADPDIAAEWHDKQKLERDPRITRVGRFLRATSLDELPQVLNVLKGEMSLVGPRPFMKNQEALYRDAGGAAYFLMRPGITGLWQLEGRNATAFVDRVAYDDLYWACMSFQGDLRCLFATIGVVFRRTGR